MLTAEQSGSSENLRAKASSTADKTGRATRFFPVPFFKESLVRRFEFSDLLSSFLRNVSFKGSSSLFCKCSLGALVVYLMLLVHLTNGMNHTSLLAYLSLQCLTPFFNADVDRVVITQSGASSPQSEAGESSVFHQEKDVVEGAPSEADGAEAEAPEEETTENVGEATYSYDRLISKSTDPVRGIDYKRREVCLHLHS